MPAYGSQFITANLSDIRVQADMQSNAEFVCGNFRQCNTKVVEWGSYSYIGKGRWSNRAWWKVRIAFAMSGS